LSLSAQNEFVIADTQAQVRSDYRYRDDLKVVDEISANSASCEIKLPRLTAGIQKRFLSTHQISQQIAQK
jgi:hypothetical protein